MTKRGPTDEIGLDIEWSPWVPLDPSAPELADLPTSPGLYRVRHLDRDGLEYVGETGRSLRGRIRALARNAFADEMPYRDPHTAAPCLWAVREIDGPRFEVSTARPHGIDDQHHRKGLEAALIAIARREYGSSPTANFGRMVPGYEQSGYSRDGFRGGPLGPDETDSHTEPGRGPLSWTNVTDPTGGGWMGLDWTAENPLRERLEIDLPGAGVYRLRLPRAEDLAYVGETSAFTGRLRSHEGTYGGEILVSVASPDGVEDHHKRTEIETELIGAHVLATGAPPRHQFGRNPSN